jgi:hypothetical protein
MSTTPDPLEGELAALRPYEISPGLRRQIARRLAGSAPAPFRWLWRFALAGGLAAACLTMVLVWRGGGVRMEPEQVVRPQPAPPVPGEDAGPTLLAYERALDRSPEALDALLDKDAGVVPEVRPDLVRSGAFTRSEAALHALLGEH